MACEQWASVISGFLSAVFWFWSASVTVPDLMQTKISGEGSITSIMQRQSRLSAIAAMFAAISVATLATANYGGGN